MDGESVVHLETRVGTIRLGRWSQLLRPTPGSKECLGKLDVGDGYDVRINQEEEGIDAQWDQIILILRSDPVVLAR